MMDSVRYLSYHQWRARKEEGVKPLQYHDKLLANVEMLQDNVGAIDRHIKDYLDVTKSFCGAGSHIGEAFCLVLKDTPLSEITQQLKQVVEEIDHVAHKSSLHIMNNILGTLCEFTATFPDLKRAIEAHKRSAQNYESCQENLEALDRDETLCENSKRFKIAKKRFRSADEELSTEEENLYRSFSEVEENRVKMLGSCFLSLLQVQSQFLSSSSELMSPVGSFQEIGDYLRDREVTLALKDATTAWLSLAQANQGLRQGKGLTRYDVHLLAHSNDEDLSESERKQLSIRVELLLKNYQKEFQRAPTPEADIPGGFQKHPKGIELALKGCCSETEAIAAGGQLELISKEEMEAEIVKHLPKLQLKIGVVVHETCPSPSKAPDNLKSKLHCIRELVNSVATHNDIPLNKENLDQFVASVLYEACSPVCMSSSKTAVQLLFGRANLVMIKPCKEFNTRQAQVFVKSTSVHVEVLSTWTVTADQTLFACLSRDLDLSATLGIVDATSVAKFSLMDYLEDKERPLPTIYIKKHTSQSPSTQLKQESSPTNKQNRFRKSLTKATSKIFSRKSSQGTKQSGSAGNALGSPTSSAPSAGTSSGSPGTDGNRISIITSSTEPSNDFDNDEMENFAPLPPPRPKHWARKVRQQNMGEVEKTTVESDKTGCEEKKDDWYSADCKFPLPMFKPTLPDSQSQLSVASQQELDEVIKFLSGTPLKKRKSGASDNVDNSSHVTPADSGIGSTFSIALSTVTQPSTADGASTDMPIPSITTSAPLADAVKETKKEGKSRKGKNKQDSDTKKENSKVESTKGKKSNKKAEKSANKVQDSGTKNETQSKEKQANPKGVVSPKEAQTKTEIKEKGKVKEQKSIEDQENKACPSPVVVTVSSVDDDLQNEQDKVTISESLRSVWENADTSKNQKDSTATALQLRKEKYGSQETLYHSCWSLSEFNDKGHKDEDTRSLNESMLPSNASPVMDLGLNWPIGFASDVWGSNPNVSETNETETGQWCRSDESLDRTNLGGKSAFSLGLGITGPELFAAASQAGRDDIIQGKGLSVPDMNKPWSTEDLTSKDPWPRRSASPSQQPQWSKTSSLTDDTQRQSVQRQTLPAQHYSDPFLPQEHWWSQVGPGLPHPSHPRYQQYLQRQYSVDVNFQGVQGNTRGGYPQVGLSAFQPVHPRGFQKPTRPAHLQVPAAYPNGNGNHNNHHASNPRF